MGRDKLLRGDLSCYWGYLILDLLLDLRLDTPLDIINGLILPLCASIGRVEAVLIGRIGVDLPTRCTLRFVFVSVLEAKYVYCKFVEVMI